MCGGTCPFWTISFARMTCSYIAGCCCSNCAPDGVLSTLIRENARGSSPTFSWLGTGRGGPVAEVGPLTD